MVMSKFVRLASLAMAAGAIAIAGCSGSSSPSASGNSGAAPAPSSSGSSAQSTQPAKTDALLGVLPIPHGASAWSSNKNATLGLKAFVKVFYVKSAWARETALYKRRHFTSGVIQGWINSDGSQQEIAIAQFAKPAGAKSLFKGLTGTLKDEPAPVKQIKDATDGGVGTVDSTLDSLGNATVEMVGHTGTYVIDVHQFTAATPDQPAAESLLLTQYTALKS